jgi:hypothetical protein
MKTVKAAGACSIRDATGQQAGIEDLRRRDHAVLIGGNLCDCGVRPRFVAFLRHIRRKATKAAFSPHSLPVFVVRPARTAGFIAGFRRAPGTDRPLSLPVFVPSPRRPARSV